MANYFIGAGGGFPYGPYNCYLNFQPLPPPRLPLRMVDNQIPINVGAGAGRQHYLPRDEDCMLQNCSSASIPSVSRVPSFGRYSGSRSFSRSPTPQRLRRSRNSRRQYDDSSPHRSFTKSRSPSLPQSRARFESRSRTRSLSRSPSPQSGGYRYKRDIREKPMPSRCIGVFGLSVHTTQHRIREIFSKYGPIERIQVVIDAQTGRSRGFCFIYYEKLCDAKDARDHCCGMEIDGRRIRVAFSITERPHTPTPGVYMGRSTRYWRDRYRQRNRRRSPSMYGGGRGRMGHGGNYRRGRQMRSRSPSYSSRRSRY